MSNNIKVHSLTGRITPQLMHKAFKAVKRNRGAAGIDKVSIAMFEANLDDNLNALMRDLKKGLLQPKPLRRVFISKGPRTKKMRPLGIPVVRDRVAQEVLRRLLAPIFEPKFHRCSFGFIKNRNCHMAIEELLRLHKQGYNVVLDADVKAFFDQIPHTVIMNLLADKVADGNILNLVHRFLTAGVMEDGVFKPTTVGTGRPPASFRAVLRAVFPLSCQASKSGTTRKGGGSQTKVERLVEQDQRRESRPVRPHAGLTFLRPVANSRIGSPQASGKGKPQE